MIKLFALITRLVFFKLVLLSFFLGLLSYSNVSSAMEIKDITLFSETYGDIKNPAILLNAGAGNQAISWPEQFCTKLAQKGYFVIRYDYRDTGLSSAINYDIAPYNILDLTKDTKIILAKHGIQKAHYVGFSMGGQISQFAAAYFPEQVLSLTLIGTSTDFMPGFDAFEGKPKEIGLSQPDADYVKWATRKVNFFEQTLDEKINDYVLTWKLLDGSPEDFDEDFYRQQAKENYTRTKLLEPYINHAKAMKGSAELHKNTPEHIKVPTLIIHGAKDPVFRLDHGEALHTKIKGSKLMVLDNFAHAINPRNFDRLVNDIDEYIHDKK